MADHGMVHEAQQPSLQDWGATHTAMAAKALVPRVTEKGKDLPNWRFGQFGSDINSPFF